MESTIEKKSPENHLTIMVDNGIIYPCGISFLIVGGAGKNLSVKRPARVALPSFALSAVLVNIAQSLKPAFIAVKNSIIIKINIFALWNALVKSSVGFHSAKSIKMLFQRQGRGVFVLKNIINGRVMTWDMFRYIDGYIENLDFQWCVRFARRLKITEEKFTGPIEVENTSGKKMIGFGCV